MPREISKLLSPLRELHNRIRSAVVNACEAAELEALSKVVHDQAGDTIYAIDRVSETALVEFFEREIAVDTPIVLIAEGLEDGQLVLPAGSNAEEAHYRIIVDPIDGTRGLMYQKRSAWILTGVAPNNGEQTTLQDIELAVQTEIPLLKQHLSDQLWAVKGETPGAVRFNRLTGEEKPLRLGPSTAGTIAHGFAMVSRFFPGAREELAAIDEEIVFGALGPTKAGKAHCFEDQYICSGGQLYELMAGHDRFVADLRPLMEEFIARRGQPLGICCHPYDMCTELIARQLGVIVTNQNGQPLSAPLTVDADVTWVGYANERIRRQIEPLLRQSLRRRGLA